MKQQIENVKKSILSFEAKTEKEVEDFRLRFLVKKGEVNSLFEEFKKLTKEEKRKAGSILNDLNSF